MIPYRKSALLTKAASPVVEFLEKRQLLSATISVSSTLMVFNAVENSSASQVETLTLTNVGDASLTLGSSALSVVANPSSSSDESARFTIVNASSAPASLAPGASFGVQLDYKSLAVETDSAILTINTNDPVSPTADVTLNGIGTKGLGGTNQPSLATILQAYNIPTYVGEGVDDANASTDSTYPYPPDASSQEVVIQRFQKAGAGPVTINVLASFTATGFAKSYTLGTYIPGEPTTLNELFYTPGNEAQSTYVQPQGATSFDPGSTPFGFYFISNVQTNGRVGYSEDALNTWDTTTGRHFRFFPMETPSGTVVPDEYIMTSTEWNAPVGYDFTNIVAIVSNVEPANSAPSAPVLGLQNLNALPGSNTLVFNKIETPNATLGDVVHNIATEQINNTGESPLIISSYTLSSQWQLSNPPTFPVTIAAGSSLDLKIQFIATTVPSSRPDNETNGTDYPGGGGVYSGTLTLNSNDPYNPTASVPLEGWWQNHSENDNEPGLQTIVNMMEGWDTYINSNQVPELTESLSTSGSKPTYYGEEVVSGYWQRADPSAYVTVNQIAAYHTEGNTETTSWYVQGSSGSTNKLFVTAADDGQTMFPYETGTSNYSIASFNTSSVFGFKVGSLYSDDSLNTGTANGQGGGHHFRFYPVRTSSGELVPNTYIMAYDYSTTDENFDFQDNLYLVTNIRPATLVSGITSPQSTEAPPAPTDEVALQTSSGVNTVTWAGVIYSNLGGYNLFRSTTTPLGTYTQLNTTAIAGTSYVDSAAPTSGTVYYKVESIDSVTGTHSFGDIVSVSSGTTTTTPTGDPIADGETINAQTGVAVAINAYGNSTDASGTLLPASVTVSTAPADGTATVNTTTGVITYTSTLGYSGVDTFQYTIADSTGVTSAPATVTINVSATPIGDPMVANLSETTLENTPITVNVAASATDNTSATIVPASTVITEPPIHGIATIDPTTGDIIYTPTTGYLGTDTLQYTIGDSLAATSQPAIITYTIAAQSAPGQGPMAAAVTAAPIIGDSPETIVVLSSAVDKTGTLNPSLVTISTEPANGSASINTANGTIIYTPNVGFVGVDTLQYTVADSHNVSSPATVTLNVGLAINTATARTLTFIDAGGSRVTMSFTGAGTGDVFFNGAAYYNTFAKTKSITVSGSSLGISAIDLTGTTTATSLTITRRGFSSTTLGSLTVTGSMNRIIAPYAALTGALSVSGTLNQLQLGSATGATITIGAGTSKSGLTFTAGAVTNTNLTSGIAIRTLKVASWINGGSVDAITAPSINSLSTTGVGNFDADLTTTGGSPYSLNSVRIGGQVAGDPWSVTGPANSIVVGSLASGWAGKFTGNLNGLTIRAGGFTGTLTAGTIGGLNIVGNTTGTITAASIKSIKVTGQLIDTSLALTGSGTTLAHLTVTGETIGSSITSTGNIGSIATGGISGSNIDAGVAAGVGLPTSASQITAADSIASFTVTGRGTTFADTSIGAQTLGSLSLGEILTASSESPFGIGAGTIRSISATLDTNGKLRLSGLLLLSEGAVASYVSQNSLSLGEFEIAPGL